MLQSLGTLNWEKKTNISYEALKVDIELIPLASIKIYMHARIVLFFLFFFFPFLAKHLHSIHYCALFRWRDFNGPMTEFFLHFCKHHAVVALLWAVKPDGKSVPLTCTLYLSKTKDLHLYGNKFELTNGGATESLHNRCLGGSWGVLIQVIALRRGINGGLNPNESTYSLAWHFIEYMQILLYLELCLMSYESSIRIPLVQLGMYLWLEKAKKGWQP